MLTVDSLAGTMCWIWLAMRYRWGYSSQISLLSFPCWPWVGAPQRSTGWKTNFQFYPQTGDKLFQEFTQSCLKKWQSALPVPTKVRFSRLFLYALMKSFSVLLTVPAYPLLTAVQKFTAKCWFFFLPAAAVFGHKRLVAQQHANCTVTVLNIFF